MTLGEDVHQPLARLPKEVWTNVLSFLQPDARVSAVQYSKDQAVLTNILRVCKTWHAIASPLLYSRVQTHDLCHLLEGCKDPIIPGVRRKRELIDMVTHLILVYPKDDQLRSFIPEKKLVELSGSVRDKLAKSLNLRARLATEALQEAMIFDIGERGGEKSAIDDKRAAAETNKSNDGVCLSDLAENRPAFGSLEHLSIGAAGPRLAAGLPDARSGRVLNIICPPNVCCYISGEDEGDAQADAYFFPRDVVVDPYDGTDDQSVDTGSCGPEDGIYNLIERLAVHIDPSFTADLAVERPVPSAGGRPCIYMIDASHDDHTSFGVEDLVCQIIDETINSTILLKLHFIVKMPKPVDDDTQWHWEAVDEFFSKRYLDIFEQFGIEDDDGESSHRSMDAIILSNIRKKTAFSWDLVEEFPMCESCGQGSPAPINKDWYTWGPFGSGAAGEGSYLRSVFRPGSGARDSGLKYAA